MCIGEHFGNADAVPQPPERCLSRQAGIVRCCHNKRKAAHLPFGALHQNGTGTPRFVTASLRKNVPQSSALAFWGAASEWGRHAALRHGQPAEKCSSVQRTCLLGRCIRMGQARCASSRPAYGQMLLRAAHLSFGALHQNRAGTPRFVTVGLRPNAPQSSAPALLETQIFTGKWEGTHHGIGCRHSFAGSGRA